MPIMDALNHDASAQIEWSFDPGRFTLSVIEGVRSGSEIFNNYGPKSNAELLMGYGFCIPDNPHCCVLETMKAPAQNLQVLLRMTHPGYFKTSGAWNSEAATFAITKPDDEVATNPALVWNSIPPTLMELFYYIIRFERGLDIAPIEDPEEYLLRGEGFRYLPRIAFYIVSSLVPKMNKITNAAQMLPHVPTNQRQTYAKMYRDGQLHIMQSVRESLAGFLRWLRPTRLDSTGARTSRALWTLEEVLAASSAETHDMYASFMLGLQHAVGFSQEKISTVAGSEFEQHIWLLWLCFAYIDYRRQREDSKNSIIHHSYSWMKDLEAEYGDPFADSENAMEGTGTRQEQVVDVEAQPFLSIVQTAAEALPDSLWCAEAWRSDFVLDWGLRIARSEGMMMRIADNDVRYVVYLDCDE